MVGIVGLEGWALWPPGESAERRECVEFWVVGIEEVGGWWGLGSVALGGLSVNKFIVGVVVCCVVSDVVIVGEVLWGDSSFIASKVVSQSVVEAGPTLGPEIEWCKVKVGE